VLVVDNGEDGSFGNDIVEKDAGRVWCPNPFTESDAQLVHLHHVPYLRLFTSLHLYRAQAVCKQLSVKPVE